MPTFATSIHRETFERIRPLMEQLYGESAELGAEHPAWRLHRGGVQVQVILVPWGEERTVLDVNAWVTLQSDPSEEFFRFLVERNFGQRFGAFALDPVGDLQFAYRLPGHAIDKLSLRSAIEGVFWTTSSFDREIAARFGGLRPCEVTVPANFERALDDAGLRPPEDRAA